VSCARYPALRRRINAAIERFSARRRYARRMQTPPLIDGVAASRLQLPAGDHDSLLAGLCAAFAAIPESVWRDRFRRGRVLGADAVPVAADAPYRAGAVVHYYREVVDEPRIDAEETVLHLDARLLVVDKPHGLPVLPAGRHVAETLLARLRRRFASLEPVPLHRLDRDTAGLVLFSVDGASRDRYHALFREHRIDKHYEALAVPLPQLRFPLIRRSRLQRGEPFFRMHEIPGDANSETRIAVIERGRSCWRYGLQPVSGRKHQLRVHMAALGAPIRNDPLYAEPGTAIDGPLQLLAKSLRFADPVDGGERRFESRFALAAIDG
jgi:tRNA pseudouridine32 synthase/23S rRNA pseudouridine746 synthase